MRQRAYHIIVTLIARYELDEKQIINNVMMHICACNICDPLFLVKCTTKITVSYDFVKRPLCARQKHFNHKRWRFQELLPLLRTSSLKKIHPKHQICLPVFPCTYIVCLWSITDSGAGHRRNVQIELPFFYSWQRSRLYFMKIFMPKSSMSVGNN